MKALEIKKLCKTYSNGVCALTDVDLSVNQGDFFALLGANGAGKSTTIGIITSLINKTSGDVFIFGNSSSQDPFQTKRMIGLVPQEVNFNIFEKIFNILVTQAGYYGIPRKIAIPRAEYYLKKLGIWEKKDHSVRQLSGGMKRRLMIARALVHEPKLLILDEPTAGVDVEIRRSMWKFLQEINTQGTTIILTTHYLEEAENLCKNVAIIDKGRIIENNSMKNVLNKLNSQTLIFDLLEPITNNTQLNDLEIIIHDPLTIEIKIDNRYNLTQIFELMIAKNIKVRSLRNKTNRLEELFLDLITQDK